MAEMGRRLAELLDYMDKLRAALLVTTRAIDPGVATIRPRDGAWSVAENVAHLSLVENAIGRFVSKTIAQARADGVGPELSHDSILSSLDKYRLAEVVEKMNAPSTMVPELEAPMAQSLASLEASRAKLRDVLIDAGEMDFGSIKRDHPRLGEIDLYQWLLFLAQHEERHRRQIERTLTEVVDLAAESAPIV